MRYRNQKIICLFLAVFILISGIGVRMVKADSIFVSSAVKENDSCISSIATFLVENELCATELIAVKSTSHVRQMAGKIPYGHKDVKASFHALCSDMVSGFFSIFFTAVHAVQFQELYSRQTVLNYIHNKDGKKDSDSYFCFF